MPYTIIKGAFHVIGSSPDGDSVRFKAKNHSNWIQLSGRRVRKNRKNHVQLRFEGIDAPETHYKNQHQPLGVADASTDFMLEQAGITNVMWGPSHRFVTAADDGTPGFVLSRAIGKNFRPICFLFSGDIDYKDGSDVHLDEDLLKQSINYRMIEQGYAYPEFYPELFHDLRKAMTRAVREARERKLGVWALDATSGVTVDTLRKITDEFMIFPKLFRRLVTHLKSHPTVEGFKKLQERYREPVLDLSRHHFTHFDNLIFQQGSKVGLIVHPEDLVFDPIPRRRGKKRLRRAIYDKL